MRVLDLYCGQGGVSYGFWRAGFDVVGVDWYPQRQYPFEFHCEDVITVLQRLLKGRWWYELESFDLIVASPPCQMHSDLAVLANPRKHNKDMIAPTRELLQQTGRHYVIENVEGAPLHEPIVLCGTMFPRLRVIRHRLFETNWPLKAPPHPPGPHPYVFTYNKNRPHYGKIDPATGYIQVVGSNFQVENGKSAMGIYWMDKRGLSQAIPPAYTKYIGEQYACHAARLK